MCRYLADGGPEENNFLEQAQRKLEIFTNVSNSAVSKIHPRLPHGRKTSLELRVTEHSPRNQTCLQAVVMFQWHLICHLPSSSSYLSWLHLCWVDNRFSLWIESSNQGEINKLKFESGLDNSEERLALLNSKLKEIQYSCTGDLGMLHLGPRSSRALLYSQIFP